MTITILQGDVRDRLRSLPDESVHCVVTSPPYWGLRDYGVEGQIGLEATMAEHMDMLVDVFREVRRVLRSDGTCWVNYGDAYTKKNRMLLPARLAIALQDDGWCVRDEIVWHKPNPMPSSVRDRTTPAHEMIYLLTKSAKYAWNFDAMQEPASENTHARSSKIKVPGAWDLGAGGHGTIHRAGRTAATYRDLPGVTPKSADEGSLVKAKGSFHATTAAVLPFRNKRSVWTVAPHPFPEAHFATFPPALIEPCILAGSPVGGVVLDPFFGSGSTGLVARQHGRSCIGIELNPEYVLIATRRLGLGVFG